MRRRTPELPQVEGDVPPALLLGVCMEVWAPEGTEVRGDLGDHPWWRARSRWSDARKAWLAAEGITDTAQQCQTIPVRSMPWSVQTCRTTQGEPWVEKQFRRAGVRLQDIAALREQAAGLALEAQTRGINR